MVLHRSKANTKLVPDQSGAHITAHITGDTNWFSSNLKRTSQLTQTVSPPIWSACHRRQKLVLHESGAHIRGDTYLFSINLERTSQVTQTGSPVI
ncbi:hypothetical protein RRG08_057240 [Elysia crispata]|uniref:Uncharacterized protein n=1 Tax=Elysia crispata TaxID=231223 RepID=A0AAE0ZU86_9GAST|nr:hypothetical protein RRG08_057240 [Elysia crispata]